MDDDDDVDAVPVPSGGTVAPTNRAGGHPKKSTGIAEPLAILRWVDWLFVGFVLWTLTYAIHQNMDFMTRTRWYDFDFLPISSGMLISTIGWIAYRRLGRAAEVLRKLQLAAALDISGDLSAFLERHRQKFRYFALLGAIIISFIAVTWTFYISYRGDAYEAFVAQMPLLAACLVGGSAVGALMGGTYSDVRLLTDLERNNIVFARIDTEEAQLALAELRATLRFAVLLGAIMAHYFIAWFALWAWGVDPGGYQGLWAKIYTLLLVISFGFFVLAGVLPAYTYTNQIAQVVGGEQLLQARSDQSKAIVVDIATSLDKLANIVEGLGDKSTTLRPDLEPNALLSALSSLKLQEAVRLLPSADRERVEQIAAEIAELGHTGERLRDQSVNRRVASTAVFAFLTAWMFVWIPASWWIAFSQGGDQTIYPAENDQSIPFGQNEPSRQNEQFK
ncbi:hypothetical protein GOA63_15110 [Sinorhizobium meliloti]|uniref:hypothetical protein n=1 Tax=Rhizobium meliloti TaxID=382 RepID=UPI0012956BA2|nr:hypothetical protein [Sinorhizobium meliloti]MDW9593536.1 hypothetical protein [Sinorhizobium meliloti]MDX0191716.1 hypothetical protein [Sinorhizobium meliloti]MQV09058.1 hypothetical protein [Sinorhizobium meliloti]